MGAETNKQGRGGGPGNSQKIEVLVITPSGIFPKNEKPRRVDVDEIVADLLSDAAKALTLTNTTDWVVFIDERQLDPQLSFAGNGLSGSVELDWHKPEGGGGAS